MIDGLESYAITTLDPTGIILSWNKGAEIAFGYGAGDAVGRHFGILFPEEDRKLGAPARDLDAAASGGSFETQGWQVDRLGRYRWHQSLTECIRDKEGKPIGFVRVSRFLARPPEAQAALEASAAAEFQRRKLEMIAHFSHRVIHDYNNLLTIVTSNLDRLRARPRDEERARNLVESALRAAQRAMTLTHQLYLFSARGAPHDELIDAVDLLRSLETPLRIAGGNGIDLQISIEMERAPVRLDPMDFEIALLSLVTNASEASGGEGVVRLAARGIVVDRAAAERTDALAPGDYLEISVGDKGRGMTPEILDRAFEPFFTTKEAGAGSGLGLTQVLGFARHCSGRVEIHSELGKGTSVALTLPITDPSDGTN